MPEHYMCALSRSHHCPESRMQMLAAMEFKRRILTHSPADLQNVPAPDVKEVSTFTSPRHYCEHFEQLLVGDVLAQAASATERKESKRHLAEFSRDWVEHGNLIQLEFSGRGELQPGDLVRLTNSDLGLDLLGYVDSSDLDSRSRAATQDCPTVWEITAHADRWRDLPSSTPFDVQVLNNIVCDLRKWTDLMNVGSLPLCAHLMNPGGRNGWHPPLSLPGASALRATTASAEAHLCWETLPDSLRRCLESKLNSSQLEAVKAATASWGITLIQGPPGTGKTSTTIAAASAILATPTEDGFLPCILICGPSNTAVDEVAERMLRDGLIGPDGKPWRPNLLRLGRLEKVRDSVKHITLDALKDARCARNQAQLRDITRHLRQNLPEEEVRNLKAEEQRLRSELKDPRGCIIREVNVIFATLGTASRPDLLYGKQVDVFLTDEAGQCTEPEQLGPFKHLKPTGRVILVGDQKQLPATVFMRGPAGRILRRSFFERLVACGYPVHLLQTQYRMHPEISSFPSHEFYQGHLLGRDFLFGSLCRFSLHQLLLLYSVLLDAA